MGGRLLYSKWILAILIHGFYSFFMKKKTDENAQNYVFFLNLPLSLLICHGICSIFMWITCCGWLLTFFAAAITASAADGFPVIGLAANKAWWCDCTCCLFKWCCNCWCCKCAAATAAGICGWWWLIVAVSDAIE